VPYVSMLTLNTGDVMYCHVSAILLKTEYIVVSLTVL
jgi:hypothetical protein